MKKVLISFCAVLLFAGVAHGGLFGGGGGSIAHNQSAATDWSFGAIHIGANNPAAIENDGNGNLNLPVPIISQFPLRIVTCGNSINSNAWINGYNPDQWAPQSEVANAMMLAPGKFEFRKLTDSLSTSGVNGAGITQYSGTGNVDMYGNWGFFGATLSLINSTIVSTSPNIQWLPFLQQNGVVPDMVVGVALLENDVVEGVSVATMEAELQTWIKIVRSYWPNVKILVLSPRPSFLCNTSQLVSNWQQITSYICSLKGQNGVWGINMGSAYENPADPATPQGVPFTGSQTGNTLTVTAMGAYLGNQVGTLAIGDEIWQSTTPSQSPEVITGFGTGTGGVGTYTVDVSQTLASGPMAGAPQAYTDGAIHPNALGAMLNGAVLAAWMRQNITIQNNSETLNGPNVNLTGSSSTNYLSGGPQSGAAGTLPTGVSFNSACNMNLNFTVQALNPGFQVNVTTVGALTPSTGNANIGSIQLWDNNGSMTSGVNRVKFGLWVNIVSGGQYLRNIGMIAYTYTNTTSQFVSTPYIQTAAALRGFPNGLYYFETPEQIPASGALTDQITRLRQFLEVTVEAGTPVGSNIVIQVLSAGWINCTASGQPQPLATVSTPTVSTGTYNYQNQTKKVVEAIVSGGTVSAVSILRGSITAATGLTSGTFVLGPSDILQITNTVAPTLDIYPLDINLQ
ncbi:MAG: hypothetical protein ACP5IL_12915 [Syntrophobacteraceae bacterium]